DVAAGGDGYSRILHELIQTCPEAEGQGAEAFVIAHDRAHGVVEWSREIQPTGFAGSECTEDERTPERRAIAQAMLGLANRGIFAGRLGSIRAFTVLHQLVDDQGAS